jgi:hypothetical protein
VRQPIPFGKYVLLERISVGGMAEVFKSKAFGVEGFEKILAIKRILPSMAEDADFIEMFIDEAKICGQLNHANICQIFELGRVIDSHFIAMEYVWGKDVLQIQNRFRKIRHTMKPDMAAFIAAKLCEGLDYAHKKKDAGGRPLGIIHRDVSPQNILVSYDGEVKIIDFGIAKAASRSSKTQAGVLKGKFGYMSPEQVRGLPLDRRSDVFAIGTILYELLTSERLFIGESDFETLEKVRNVAIPPVSTVNPEVPPELERIISKALTRDVDQRYQWASELQEQLHAFLLSRDPVFTAKQLASWMREQFAVEMKREQQVLDEQRKIGREVLQEQPAAPKKSAGDDFGGSTNVLEGAELADLVLATEVAGDVPAEFGDEAEKTTVAQAGFAPSESPLPGESTQILADQLLARSSPLPTAGETLARPASAELPAQPTVILEGGTGAAQMPPLVYSSGVLHSTPQAATLQAMPAPVLAAPNGGHHSSPLQLNAGTPANGASSWRTPAGGVRQTTGNVQPPPPYAPASRSTLWKDIAIGVAVAIAVVTGVLGVRSLLMRSSKGTVVVMVNAARAADVYLDGTLKGHVEPGAPLTVRDVAAGPHFVLVRTADGAELRQPVQVAANDVSVLTAAPRLATPPSPGTGHVKLNLATVGAQVWVDGAQLADGAWKDPIPLRADVQHDIRVTKPMREEIHMPVTLRAGESVSRDVELLPAYGKITVASEPAGAEVAVNGKHAGVTPVVVGDVDPGKPARVTLRLRGFAAVTKYLAFDKGLEQALDIKMQPESAASAIAAAKVELPKIEPPKPAAAAFGDGYLVANTQPWAKVLIDGKDTGKTTPIAPRSKIALKPGKHTVTFVANGKKFNFDVTIKPGEDTRLIKQLADGQ